MADLLFCSRYPFSTQAKEYVRERGVEITSLMLEKAESRVKDALVLGKLKKAAALGSAQEEELVAYAGARMIVSAAANRYLITRYAVAEAKRASDYLGEDAQGREEYVEKVAQEFGIRFLPEGRGFLVHFSSYLLFTPRSVDYKLSNRQLLGGNVRVSAHERVRMLEEAVRKRIEGSLPVKAEFPAQVKESAARMAALIPKLEIAVTKVGQENYPPCIRKLLEDLAMNVNVPHTGRVALAIYLVNAGVPNDAIVDCFRHAPDFSEKTTRYQVEYIRNKKYSAPSCSTMDSYGICVADCHCGSPMNFRDATHGARLRRMAEEKKDNG
jgi:DNA primase large subunit